MYYEVRHLSAIPGSCSCVFPIQFDQLQLLVGTLATHTESRFNAGRGPRGCLNYYKYVPVHLDSVWL